MAAIPGPDWRTEFETWLAPFVDRLRRKEQRRWAPVYLQGLLGPGGRESVEPMAARVAPGEVQQLHHFIAASPWATAPLEEELVRAADRLVGGPGAVPVIDDTALVKQGRRSVGVARQYCGRLGKRANRQALVSLTPASGEVPVGVGLRLFLPAAWAGDAARRARAGVPAEVTGRPKWRIALDELDRVRAAGARFDWIVADAEYGKAAAFRRGLSERGLTWAVGIPPTQEVYPADVTVAPPPPRATGRRPKHPRPSAAGEDAEGLFAALPEPAFRGLTWRRGTKGDLRAEFAALRVRVADGPVAARAQHPPGEGAWLVCERRAGGRRAQVLPRQPSGRGHARSPRRRDQGALGLRAGAPAAQGRARAGSLRGPRLARAAPPRPAHADRPPVLPPAPAAGGAAARGKKPRPAARGRRRRHPCRRCGAASSRP